MAISRKGKRAITVNGEEFLWRYHRGGAQVTDLDGRLNVVGLDGFALVKGPRFRSVAGCGGLHRLFRAPDFFWIACYPSMVAEFIDWATSPGPDPEELDRREHPGWSRREGVVVAEVNARVADPDLYYRPLDLARRAAEPHCPPLHDSGGPPIRIRGDMPTCAAAFRISVLALEAVSNFVAPDVRNSFEPALASIREAKERWEHVNREFDTREIRVSKGYDILRAVELPTIDGPAPPLRAARGAIAVFNALLEGNRPRSVTNLGITAVSVVETFRLVGETARLADFLRQFELLLHAEEFAASVVSKAKIDIAPRIEAVIWRGADKENLPIAWLVRLAHKHYGLLAKIGRRWTFVEGDKDHVLASVPDDRFAEVANQRRLREA